MPQLRCNFRCRSILLKNSPRKFGRENFNHEKDKRIMQGQPSSRITRGVVILTTLIMFAAAIGTFVF